jgi:hypothetical protein
LIALVAGCATTPPPPAPPGPRGLRASEHLDAARYHHDLGRYRFSRDNDLGWVQSWDASSQHEQIAATHRSEAAALVAEYEHACGDRSTAEVAVSPLQRYAVGGEPTANGVIIYLDASAGPVDRLLAEVKCHRAWMMLAPTDMDDCPLDLPGLVLDAHVDTTGITLSITIRNPALLPELHRRVAHELETSKQLHRE